MAELLPEQLGVPRRSHRDRLRLAYWWIGGAALVLLAGLGLMVLGDRETALEDRMADRPSEELKTDSQRASQSDAPANRDKPASTSAASALIDDDGQTLWESPTNGPPIDLAYLPPGVQIILSLRPSELLSHAEGPKILASLGPVGERGIRTLEKLIATRLPDCDRLLIGWQIARDRTWQATIVVSAQASDSRTQLLASGTEQQHAGKAYRVIEDFGYYVPSQGDGLVRVAAPVAVMDEILDLNGVAPPLPRGMERLAARTDTNRNVTLLCAPNFLFGDGGGIFSGEWMQLREPLYWFLGDEVSAVAISMHMGDDAFLELLAAPTLDASPESMANSLSTRINQLPDRLEVFLAGLGTSPHSRNVLAEFPGMVRQLASYTRRDSDKQCAVLRCYLPAIAGHNLLLGTELMLAESSGKNPISTGEPLAAQATQGVGEGLQKRTSLRFGRDTLETALNMLSADIGVPIEIRGSDLQAEGITKNQSFAIDTANKPAEEILVKILRLANPDKFASGPSDQRQRLVYVLQFVDGVADRIVVTTRTAAKQREEQLPQVFAIEASK